jgi:tellurite resistance protein
MDTNDAEELLLALVGAYVWVASSDEGVSIKEYNKFQKVLLESPFATHYGATDARHTFKDMVALFAEDFDHGIQQAKKHLQRISDNPMKCEEVIRFSRAALISDMELKDVEERVLQEITSLVNHNQG